MASRDDTTATRGDGVLLVLSLSPVRTLLRDWLRDEGIAVREAAPWEVERLVEAGEADVVVTSSDLDGEWGWSEGGRIGTVVLAIDPGHRPAPRA